MKTKSNLLFILFLFLWQSALTQTNEGLHDLTAPLPNYDSLEKVKNESEINKIKQKYDIIKKQDEISLLQKDNQLMRASAQKQILVTIVAVILVIFMSMLTIILYLSNLKAQKLNHLLSKQRNESEEKNEEIRQQKEEIEAINNSLEQTVIQRTQELQFTVENLSQRNQDLEQFSYIVSHNLRAPIARLIGLANIFNKETPEDQLNQEILSHVQQSAQNLDVIVKDLTYILSIRNDLSLKKEQIDLQQLTEEIVENLQDEVIEAKPRILFDFNKAQSIFSVKSYLENMIYQLLSNALKYKRKREPLQIEISTSIQDKMLILSIKDNGLGIDLTKIDPYKIFGLYQRMHTHVEGKGLGLYLVKTQIEALGGRVEVESKENMGSVFSIFLPIH